MTRRLLRCLPLLFWVAVGAALPACHSNGQTARGRTPTSYSCTAEPRATPYQPGMQVTSTNGTFIVKLLSNTFTDSSGKTKDEDVRQRGSTTGRSRPIWRRRWRRWMA